MKWLFFDIGSTLVNEEKAYGALIANLSEQTNISFDELYRVIIEAYKNNLNGFKYVVEKLNAIKPKWNANLEELYEDTIIVLEELHKKYKIGIIANQSLGLEKRLEKLGINKYIDLLVYSEKEGFYKPNLKLFEIALERSGCDPKDSFMIGDRIDNDIIPAKQLNMKTIWIKQGFGKYWNINNTLENPDIIVSDLKDLWKVLNGSNNE